MNLFHKLLPTEKIYISYPPCRNISTDKSFICENRPFIRWSHLFLYQFNRWANYMCLRRKSCEVQTCIIKKCIEKRGKSRLNAQCRMRKDVWCNKCFECSMNCLNRSLRKSEIHMISCNCTTKRKIDFILFAVRITF